MEVTTDNFHRVLPEIEKDVKECSFLAIDTELSGLHVSDDKDNCFETVEERYQSIRNSASEFLVLQFGLVAFFYDEDKDEFSHKAYNFFTFPRQAGRHGPNIRFLCESSSIEFLCSFGFDFNKLFYKGIPHLTLSGESKMREDLDKRQAYLASEEGSAPIPVPEYMKKFMADAEAIVQRFVASKKTEYNFENLNAFQRKLIFHNIKPKYGAKLYFETISDNDGDSADSVSESDKSDSEASGTSPLNILSGSKKKSANGPAETTAAPEFKTPAGEKKKNPRDRILRVRKVNETDIKAMQDERKQQELDVIEKAVGFSKVIRQISQSGKIVVGHNMLLDVAHAVSQFVDKLPDNLADFKQVVLACFPNLVDTKLMANSLPFRDLISSSVLFDLLQKLQGEPFVLPEVKTVPGKEEYSYRFSEEKKHEAGYDAYVTGLCFIGMKQYLGTLQDPKKSIVLPESPLVMPFINKMYIMRMLDIMYLNISGTDLTPSRSHVFHVTCPKDATQKNIQDMFSPFGQVQLYWQNQKSVFISLLDKDQAPLVMRNIDISKDFVVVPFDQYQKQLSDKKRPLQSENSSPDSSQVSTPLSTSPQQTSSKSSKSTCGQKKKRPKTETSDMKKSVAPVFDQPSTWD